MNKLVFVTGATAGFGKAIAEKYAAAGCPVIITGRRKERLQQLQQELQQKYNVKVLPLEFDVQNRKEVFQAIKNLPAEWRPIDILVNNAGLAAGRDYFDEADLDDWDTMIDTNVKGLLYVSKAVIPLMIKKDASSGSKGHIINMGSIAGKEVYEKGNVYCASKFAVDAISQSMRIDLLRHGIKVTAIHPGAAETEFSLVRFKGDTAKATAIYEGYKPLTAGDIAEVVFFCTVLPEHVCINELALTPSQQANTIYFHKDNLGQ
ncbi:MAG: SDR family NAD(P)-dependent oxidoreductase [Chitinophagaceae bacterium]|nr:SDR family NAD(P)-dependent oxidoreductase [Chitinophagaceae bacterium]